MAKSASPIRLQEELMQSAKLTAKRFHRSTAEQIEYWASLGRRVALELDPDVLLSVTSGLAILKTEPVFNSPLEPENVFQSLEQDRKAGLLSDTVTSSAIRYQASKKYIGYLEQIDQDGNITTGQFENGHFIALNGSVF
jgi:hypothetical protein